MTLHRLQLDPDPAAALRQVVEASRARGVLVFKKSPICPVSHRAVAELSRWAESMEGDAESDAALAEVDVIAERELARGLTRELDVQHESPQALWFRDGALAWHDSHGALTAERFAELLTQR